MPAVSLASSADAAPAACDVAASAALAASAAFPGPEDAASSCPAAPVSASLPAALPPAWGVMSAAEFDQRLVVLRPQLLRLARTRLDYENAENTVQEALCTAWNVRARFNPACDNASFLAWLKAIVRFQITATIQEQASQRESALPPDVIFDLCDGPATLHWEHEGWRWQRAEMYRRVESGVLPAREKECTLRWLNGETLQGIGLSLNPTLTPGGVSQLIARVGKRLAAIQAEEEGDGSDVAECLQNLPAALTYATQQAQWKRAIREADAYAQRYSLRQSVVRQNVSAARKSNTAGKSSGAGKSGKGGR